MGCLIGDLRFINAPVNDVGIHRSNIAIKKSGKIDVVYLPTPDQCLTIQMIMELHRQTLELFL
jgi:hypothetical protein